MHFRKVLRSQASSHCRRTAHASGFDSQDARNQAVCVCVCVCLCVCVCVCTHKCIYTHLRHTQAYLTVKMQEIKACVCVCVCVCVHHKCIHTHLFICIYALGDGTCLPSASMIASILSVRSTSVMRRAPGGRSADSGFAMAASARQHRATSTPVSGGRLPRAAPHKEGTPF